MPIEIKDLATHKGFLTKLKLEPLKAPAGEFVFYEKYPFPEGEKPLLLLGATVLPAVKEHVKKQKVVVKGSGTYQAISGGNLEFVVQSGSLQSTHITSCGLKGSVKGETPQVQETGSATKQVVAEVEQKGSAGEATTGEQEQKPKKTFQTATAKKTEGKEIKTTGNEREQLAQVQQFVKQRQDLLKFSQAYLVTMTNFHKQAEEAATMARGFIERADGGESNEHLATMVEDQLGFCERLLKDAEDTYQTDGTEVANGRQVNPSKFIEDLTLAQATGQKYKHIFDEVAKVTQQCAKANGDIQLTMGEVIRELTLVLPKAKTGQADLKDVLAYLDKTIQATNDAIGKMDRSIMVDSVTRQLKADMDNKKVTKEQLAITLSTSLDKMADRKRVIAEVYPRSAALAKSALKRMQDSKTDPNIQTRYKLVQEALVRRTQMKIAFDKGCEEFDTLAAEADVRIKS